MPYCRKCGKWIETEGDLCDDCRNAELIFGEAPLPERRADSGSRMDGFPKALVSAILGVTAALIVSIVNVLMAGYLIAGKLPAVSVILSLGTVAAVGAIIVSVLFGVKSIKKFVDNKNRGKVRPIATLVCGIGGCASSGVALMYLIGTIFFFILL